MGYTGKGETHLQPHKSDSTRVRHQKVVHSPRGILHTNKRIFLIFSILRKWVLNSLITNRSGLISLGSCLIAYIRKIVFHEKRVGVELELNKCDRASHIKQPLALYEADVLKSQMFNFDISDIIFHASELYLFFAQNFCNPNQFIYFFLFWGSLLYLFPIGYGPPY